MESSAFMPDGAVYLDVPFRCKDEAKLAGAFWVPGVKKWAIDIDDAEALRPFWPRIRAAAIEKAVEESRKEAAVHQADAIERCGGRGECFVQDNGLNSIRIGACPKGCELKHCSNCLTPEPEWLLDCHRGRCMNCAVALYNGVPNGFCEYCKKS